MGIKVEKFNEFINNEDLIINQLIEEAESTPLSDLVAISKRDSYKKVISLGEKVVPYLLDRVINGDPIWNIGLGEILGEKFEPSVDNLGFYNLKVSEMQDFWKKWKLDNDKK